MYFEKYLAYTAFIHYFNKNTNLGKINNFISLKKKKLYFLHLIILRCLIFTSSQLATQSFY